jgi:hypothetical protein
MTPFGVTTNELGALVGEEEFQAGVGSPSRT